MAVHLRGRGREPCGVEEGGGLDERDPPGAERGCGPRGRGEGTAVGLFHPLAPSVPFQSQFQYFLISLDWANRIELNTIGWGGLSPLPSPSFCIWGMSRRAPLWSHPGPVSGGDMGVPVTHGTTPQRLGGGEW